MVDRWFSDPWKLAELSFDENCQGNINADLPETITHMTLRTKIKEPAWSRIMNLLHNLRFIQIQEWMTSCNGWDVMGGYEWYAYILGYPMDRYETSYIRS